MKSLFSLPSSELLVLASHAISSGIKKATSSDDSLEFKKEDKKGEIKSRGFITTTKVYFELE